MKQKCQNGVHCLNDEVFFTVIVNERLYFVKYKIIEKIESLQGFSYAVEVLQEQIDDNVNELVRSKNVGTGFRVCGDSLFKTKEEAILKNRTYFERLLSQLKEDFENN